MSDNRYQGEYIRNRREAIKDILKENLVKNVSVTNQTLIDKFNEGKKN
jgi:hypothetical protein